MDAADPRTRRGRKLERDKINARNHAKVWIIFFFLEVIFFISLRVSDSTPNTSCSAKGSCDCLNFFDAFYTAHVLLMFFYAGFRVKLGCRSKISAVTRRELKVQSR